MNKITIGKIYFLKFISLNVNEKVYVAKPALLCNSISRFMFDILRNLISS